VLILDLDVHQGDGTAAMCAGNPSIFTLSVHAANNFPARKQQSTLDVPLPDRMGDADYLKTVAEVRQVLAPPPSPFLHPPRSPFLHPPPSHPPTPLHGIGCSRVEKNTPVGWDGGCRLSESSC
jgi:hypothetical protein